MQGAEVILDASTQMIEEGKKYSEVSDQFWQGMTFVAGGISTMYLSMAIGGELTHMASFVDFRIGILSTKVFANSMPALGGTWFGLRGYTPTSKPVVSGKELVNNRYIQIEYANTNFGDKAVYIGSPLLAQKGPQVIQNVMSNLPMLGQQTTTTALSQIPQVASTPLPTILTPSLNTPLISMVGNNLQASSTGIGNQVGTLVQNSNPNAGVLTEGEDQKIKDDSKIISEADRIKINNWDYTPSNELYFKYKDVYDNPLYYDQTTGGINWPIDDGFKTGSKMDKVVSEGTIFKRYGGNSGQFLGNATDSFESRALAPHSEGVEIRFYILTENYKMTTGEAASWFGSNGGAEQFVKYKPDGGKYTIKELEDAGILEDITDLVKKGEIKID
jgi:hypothetical protein